MRGNRIRWQVAAKVVAVAACGAVGIAVAPSLLETPEPPPLPADVGLATGASGAQGYAPVGPGTEGANREGKARERGSEQPDEPRRQRGRAVRETEPKASAAPRAERDRERRSTERDQQAPPPPPPPPPVEAPVAAPAPAPPPTAAPPPAPIAPPSPPPAEAEFGFERP